MNLDAEVTVSMMKSDAAISTTKVVQRLVNGAAVDDIFAVILQFREYTSNIKGKGNCKTGVSWNCGAHNHCSKDCPDERQQLVRWHILGRIIGSWRNVVVNQETVFRVRVLGGERAKLCA